VIKAIIKLNGKYYAGQSEETEKINIGPGGWYSQNKQEVNKLIFTEDSNKAKEAYGLTNLKSELNRIFDRIDDGLIELEKIEIINPDVSCDSCSEKAEEVCSCLMETALDGISDY
jgi:hypothetical protein